MLDLDDNHDYNKSADFTEALQIMILASQLLINNLQQAVMALTPEQYQADMLARLTDLTDFEEAIRSKNAEEGSEDVQ